jgi:C-terminal peptidase prc
VRKRFLLLTSLLVTTGLACQAAYRLVLPPTATPQPSATATTLPSVTPSITPILPTPEPTLVIDLVTTTPESPDPHSALTVTPTPLPKSLQLSVFKDLWQAVNDNYLYPDFNGLDWQAVYDDYTAKIDAGMTNAEFYMAMDEALYSLGDDHSFFLDPDMVIREQAEYEGNLDYVGIGVLISAFPDLDRAVILIVFPNSPAERAGLQARDSILTVDGEPILDEDGGLKNILRGPEGSQITILVETPGQVQRELTITRGAISTSMPVPSTILETSNGKRIGYLFLTTLNDSTVDESFADALRDMSSQGELDGIIIDNRENSGGADTVMRPILSYFVNGIAGYFISRDGERPLNLRNGEDIRGSQDIPLVVLVGSGTASYGEVFSGVLKDLGRAYLIGETTGGNVETLWGYDFEDGSIAWIAHESFRPLNHPDQDWEQTGIIPDLSVDGNWFLYPIEQDPAILAALDHLDQ